MLSKIAKQALRATFSIVAKPTSSVSSAVNEINNEARNTAV